MPIPEQLQSLVQKTPAPSPEIGDLDTEITKLVGQYGFDSVQIALDDHRPQDDNTQQELME